MSGQKHAAFKPYHMEQLRRLGMGGLESCDMHDGESNYAKLLGTPEKAARTLAG